MDFNDLLYLSYELVSEICYKFPSLNSHKKFCELNNDIKIEYGDLKDNSILLNWESFAVKTESLLSQLLKYSHNFITNADKIPGELSHQVTLLQYTSIVLLKRFFAKETLDCVNISPRIDNLLVLELLASCMKCYAYLDHYTILVSENQPVKFLNLVLDNCSDIEKPCEKYCKSGFPFELYSDKLVYLILKLKDKIKEHQSKKD